MPPQQPQSPYPGGNPAPGYPPNQPPQPSQPGQPVPASSVPPSPYSTPPPQPYQPPQPPQQPAPSPFATPTGFRLTGRFKGSQPVIPPPPARPTSPYDFFMNNQQRGPAKPSGLPFPKPKTAGAQIAWIAGGGLSVVILIGLITLAIPKGDPKLTLVTVAQAQTETLRVCTLGQQQATQSSTKAFALNCYLSLLTDQRQLTTYLSKAGAGVKGKVLSGGYNATADKRLTAAKSASDYDDVFRDVVQSQLMTQTRTIQQAAGSATTTAAEKSALNKYSDSTKLLLQQLKQ